MGDGLGVSAGSGETEDSGDAVGSGVSVGFGDAVGSGEAVGVGSAEGSGEATGVGSAVGIGETGAVGVGEGHGRAARAGDGMRVSSINSAAIIDIAVLFICFSSLVKHGDSCPICYRISVTNKYALIHGVLLVSVE